MSVRTKKVTFPISLSDMNRSIRNVLRSHRIYKNISEDGDGQGFTVNIKPFFLFGSSALMTIHIESDGTQTSVTVQILAPYYRGESEWTDSFDQFNRMLENFLAALQEEVKRSLLRPASAPEETEQTLLHPTNKPKESPPEELIRSSEP